MLEQIQAKSSTTIHSMEYRNVAVGLPASMAETDLPDNVEALECRIHELETELKERLNKFESELETARENFFEEGRKAERSEHSLRMAAATQAMMEALQEFKYGRDRYLSAVEQEVVRLALAISARILHRESMMDPLLLTGAVRVALGQLADTTEVRLKIPSGEYELWCEVLRLMPNLPLHPEIVADASMKTGDCVIETHLGSVDLGVRSQLTEIERGFFDLLEHRSQSVEQRPDYGEPRRHASLHADETQNVRSGT